LKLAQCYFLDQMISAFSKHQIRTWPRRENILAQVLQIDVRPKAFGNRQRRILRQLRIAMEEGFGVLERGFTQAHETVDVPLMDEILGSIDIDREIEEIRDKRNELAVLGKFACLKHVNAFEH